MWSEVLGGILKQGTNSPEVEKNDKQDNTQLYIAAAFGVVALVAIVFILNKFSK